MGGRGQRKGAWPRGSHVCSGVAEKAVGEGGEGLWGSCGIWGGPVGFGGVLWGLEVFYGAGGVLWGLRVSYRVCGVLRGLGVFYRV